MGRFTLLRNCLRPGYARVIAAKAVKRLEVNSAAESAAWVRGRAISIETFCGELDLGLWRESLRWSAGVRNSASAKVRAHGISLGGGGAYPLLYFLARYLRPHIVLETGVAAGWSSYAFLAALERNGEGHLYSSDFPYFRQRNPENFIGIVVPHRLKSRWTLDVKGDKRAIPSFLKQIDEVQLVHYDSDKSMSGRAWFCSQILPLMRKGSYFVMDDIQDNVFFRDLVSGQQLENWVLEFEGKFVGVIRVK